MVSQIWKKPENVFSFPQIRFSDTRTFGPLHPQKPPFLYRIGINYLDERCWISKFYATCLYPLPIYWRRAQAGKYVIQLPLWLVFWARNLKYVASIILCKWILLEFTVFFDLTQPPSYLSTFGYYSPFPQTPIRGTTQKISKRTYRHVHTRTPCYFISLLAEPDTP